MERFSLAPSLFLGVAACPPAERVIFPRGLLQSCQNKLESCRNRAKILWSADRYGRLRDRLEVEDPA